MVVRSEIAPHLRSRPFSVGEALAAGMTPGALKGPELRAPFRGVRVPADLPEDLETDCRALLVLLGSDAAFTGATGALLRRLPLPLRSRGRRPLHVVVPAGAARPRIAGVVVREAASPVVGRVRGLPVEDSAGVWASLVPELSLVEAVALGDAVLRTTRDPSALDRVVARRTAGRYVERLREVAALARCGVDSPMETRWRLLVTGVGIPEPELGGDVLDDAGGWIARPDGQWRSVRVAVEYEGDHHRTDRRQWQSDVARDRLLQRAGYVVLRLTASSLHVDAHRTIDDLWGELARRGLSHLPSRPAPAAVRSLVSRLDAVSR